MFESQFVKYTCCLGKIADSKPTSFVYGQESNISTISGDLCCVRGSQADCHIECGRFIGADCPKQTNHFSGFNIKIRPIDNNRSLPRISFCSCPGLKSARQRCFFLIHVALIVRLVIPKRQNEKCADSASFSLVTPRLSSSISHFSFLASFYS